MKKVLLFLILLILPIGAKGYYCDYEDYNIAQKKAQMLVLLLIMKW